MQCMEVRSGFDGSWEELDVPCSQLMVIRREYEAHGTIDTDSISALVNSGVSSSTPMRSACLPPCGPGTRHLRTGKPRYVLSPTSKFRLLWDMISMLMLGYDMVSLPYALAFNIPQSGFLSHFSSFSLAFWCIDILITFRTGIYMH